MINPVHHLKKFVKYAGNEKPTDSYVYDASGWLGSGVKDCNGQEIFEGDIVNVHSCFEREKVFTYLVIFQDGKLALENGNGIYAFERPASLEVIGHIAEEET